MSLPLDRGAGHRASTGSRRDGTKDRRLAAERSRRRSVGVRMDVSSTFMVLGVTLDVVFHVPRFATNDGLVDVETGGRPRAAHYAPGCAYGPEGSVVEIVAGQPARCGASSPGVHAAQPTGVKPPSSGWNSIEQTSCCGSHR